MKTAGIIAEYNPFHNGHLHQLTQLRERFGADRIVVAMSGDFVQRGGPALLNKHTRAEMALRCGADLVLELPAAFSCASAEHFAAGGVSLLDGIGVIDLLCFGSEAGELTPFLETADVLLREPDAYRQALSQQLRRGVSFPLARSRALTEYFREYNRPMPETDMEAFLCAPNNILGIEYCKALLSLGSSVRPVTIRRAGCGYHSEKIVSGDMPSASAIRTFLREADTGAVSPEAFGRTLSRAMPQEALSLLLEAVRQKEFLTEEDLDILLHYRLLEASKETLLRCADVSEALANRILNTCGRYEGFSQYARLLHTRELTEARIRRALLHILLQIREIPPRMPYARILGFRREAAPLLHAVKEKSRIPLISKLADASALLDEEGLRVLEGSTFASNVYESLLCKKAGRAFLHEYTRPAVIL